MKNVSIFFFIFSSFAFYSQKIESFNDRAELERITRVINLSGQKLNKSAQQQIHGLIIVGLGSLTTTAGGLTQNTDLIYGGALVSTISIPYFISSILNKKKAGVIMKEFELKEISIKNHKSSVENSEVSSKNSEPKYMVGQTVYFYKGGKLTKAKIIFLDTIGLRIEYFDSVKDKTKEKFVTFEKVFTQQP